MPNKQHARQLGADRAGLDDFRVAAESRLSLSQNSVARQAAEGRLRRQRLVEQVHQLGARVVFELIDELDHAHDLGNDLDERLARYADLNSDLLVALGGDRFPASPIRAVSP